MLRAEGGEAALGAAVTLGEAGSPGPPAFGPAPALPLIVCNKAFNQLQLFVLFLQEEVNKHSLLLFDLFTDVLGDVRDHPVNQNTKEHHQVLKAQQQM